MAEILRNRRLPAVVLLFLCVSPPCAQAQQFVCWPIQQGDTASELSRRLTGDTAAVYSHAFQIRDPVRKMFVPKSRYQRLSTDWQACVATGPVKGTPPAYAPVVALGASGNVPEEPAITSRPLAVASASLAGPSGSGSRLDTAFAAKAGGAVLVVLAISAAAARSVRRRPIPPLMQRAGEQFVAAFERPLVDASSRVPPIRTRMRFVRRRQQLEIAIAPGPGRRYPNLADHKRNVEYDVTRVMRLLGTRFVVGDRLRTAGKWVVVPIRAADKIQTGAK
jgi:hypothetical protein